jgi:hypothetical protein
VRSGRRRFELRKEDSVTFRVDDLLVAVMPEGLSKDKGCPKCSKCTKPTAVPSPCQPDDPNTQNCPPCIGSDRGTRKAQTWRDEQFALLSEELEEVLSR